MIPKMSDKETAAHIRAWAIQARAGLVSRFSWPTDECGEEQARRYSEYRNTVALAGPPGRRWSYAGTQEDFLREYADLLEAGQIP